MHSGTTATMVPKQILPSFRSKKWLITDPIILLVMDFRAFQVPT
jgi:hypothetical protein